MNEQIGRLIDLFKKEAELSKDILQSFAPSLAKLNYIANKINTNTTPIEYCIKYEQIIEKHIPDILNKYYSLPIGVRNQEIIKDNKTARQILLQELTLIDDTINVLWEDILEDDKRTFLAMNRKLNNVLENDKYIIQDNGSAIEIDENYQKNQEINLKSNNILNIELNNDFKWDINLEAQKLLKEYEGNWETDFQRPKLLTNKKRGMEPKHFFLLVMFVFLILIGIIIVF